jgi:hypothetical protein
MHEAGARMHDAIALEPIPPVAPLDDYGLSTAQ